MKISLRGAATAAFVCVTTSAAGAQGTAAAKAGAAAVCDPGASQAIAKASLYLQQAAQSVGAKQDASKPLKQAITELTTPGKDNSDVAGRAYYLGQAYILLVQQPGVAQVGTRSSYGITTNPSGTVDLLAAADTAITAAETALPACKPELAQWREQKPWLDALNSAIAAVNSAKFDSAAVYANRALTIDRRAPYAYTVLASVASNKKDYATAATMLQKALDAASADTIYNDAKLNAAYDLANTYTMQYEEATGAAKAAAAQQAIAAWESYIPLGNSDARIAHAVASATQIMQAMKDTGSLPKAYAAIVADPPKFGEQTLLNAGVTATQAKRPADAVKLFAAVIEKNPSQRDGLKNLAASYVGTGESQKMIPVVDKLVALDPNNADNWQLYAYAYSGMLKGTKDSKLVKAYTDSLVKYNTKSEKLTPRVEIREFSFGGDDKTATLGGVIQNASATAKSYAIQVEFLDRSGAVVGTQTVNVGPVAPKASAPFKATLQNATAVAYRYKPIA